MDIAYPESSTGALLQAANKRLDVYRRRVIRETTGLGDSDFGVLVCLARGGSLPVSTVGRKLLLTSGSVTTAVDRVERRGLVSRMPDPADRRGVLVSLTHSGRETVQGALPKVLEATEAALAGLEEAERAHLANLLRKLISGLPGGSGKLRSMVNPIV